jgi:hypothetical protein
MEYKKEVNKDSYTRSKMSRHREINNSIFMGYYKRVVYVKIFGDSIGKPYYDNVITCDAGKKDTVHDYLHCKNCISQNYIAWKKHSYKDGFKLECSCCYDNGPIYINKYTIMSKCKSELRDEENNIYKEDPLIEDYEAEDNEEEVFVKLGDYL